MYHDVEYAEFLKGSTYAHSSSSGLSQSSSSSGNGDSSNCHEARRAKEELIAQNIYEDYSSPIAEADRLIYKVVDFLHTNLQSALVPWQMSNESLERQAKAHAIEQQYRIYPDGRPAPLGFFDWLRYGTPRQLLIAKIDRARAQSRIIVDALKELGHADSHSRDVMLLQYFVLGQFSLFKRYYLNWHLFYFSAASPPLLHPLLWTLCWMFMICSQIFFLYWIFAWGASQGGVTLDEWGVNFGIAAVQDIFVIQVFRVYLIYFMAMQSIKPQLMHIYRVLNRVGVAYAQNEYQGADAVAVVQHVSPACRTARLHSCKELVTAKILHHLTDLDIADCRREYSMRMSIVAVLVILIPMMVAIVDEGMADALLQQVIPAAFTLFLVINYQIWINTGFVIVVPYLVLIAWYFWRKELRKKAKQISEKYKKLNTEDGNLEAIMRWRKRRNALSNSLQARNRHRINYCLATRYVMRMVCDFVLEQALQMSRLFSDSRLRLFISDLESRKRGNEHWRLVNMPILLQGQTEVESEALRAALSGSMYGTFLNRSASSVLERGFAMPHESATLPRDATTLDERYLSSDSVSDDAQDVLMSRIPPQVAHMARKNGVDSLASWEIHVDNNVQHKDYLTQLLHTHMLDFNPRLARTAFESSHIPDVILSNPHLRSDDDADGVVVSSGSPSARGGREDGESSSRLTPASRSFDYELFAAPGVVVDSSDPPIQFDAEDDGYHRISPPGGSDISETHDDAGKDDSGEGVVEASSDVVAGGDQRFVSMATPGRGGFPAPYGDFTSWQRVDSEGAEQRAPGSGTAEESYESADSTRGPALVLTQLQEHELLSTAAAAAADTTAVASSASQHDASDFMKALAIDESEKHTHGSGVFQSGSDLAELGGSRTDVGDDNGGDGSGGDNDDSGGDGKEQS